MRQVGTDSLIYDLKNPDAGRRTDAVRDLGAAKFLPAIPALLPLAEDSDAGVRRQVELALEEMNDIQTLSGFVTALRGQRSRHPRPRGSRAGEPAPAAPDRPDRRAHEVRQPASARGLDEYADTVVEPDVPVDASVVTALRARLSDSQDGIRRAASRGSGHPEGFRRDS